VSESKYRPRALRSRIRRFPSRTTHSTLCRSLFGSELARTFLLTYHAHTCTTCAGSPTGT
jgi:hypothetical protein